MKRIFTLFLLLLNCMGPLLAGTYYVATNGNDSTGCMDDPAKPFATVQAPLDQADAGDRVQVQAGTYSVTPVIVPWYDPLPELMAPIQLSGKSDISIEGVGSETIFYAQGPGDVLTLLNCTNIVLSNLTFVGNNPSVPDGEYQDSATPLLFSMIHLRGQNREISVNDCVFKNYGNHGISHLWSPKTSENVTITDCSFYSGGATNVTNLDVDGASVSGIGSYWTVSGSYIQDCQRGLEIECFSPLLKHEIVLQNNVMTNIFDYGIMLFATCREDPTPGYFSDIRIENNKLRSVNYGILITGGKRVQVIGNEVSYSNGVGIAVMSSMSPGSEIEITSNKVDNCIERGIQLVKQAWSLANCKILDNTVYVTGNSGILVSGEDMLVQNNRCHACGWMGDFGGIEVLGAGRNVSILGNRLVGPSMKYGIILRGGAKGSSLSQNYIESPVIASIKDFATETDYNYDLALYPSSEGIMIDATGTAGFTQTFYMTEDMKTWVKIGEEQGDNYGNASVSYNPELPLSKCFFKAEQIIR